MLIYRTKTTTSKQYEETHAQAQTWTDSRTAHTLSHHRIHIHTHTHTNSNYSVISSDQINYYIYTNYINTLCSFVCSFVLFLHLFFFMKSSIHISSRLSHSQRFVFFLLIFSFFLFYFWVYFYLLLLLNACIFHIDKPCLIHLKNKRECVFF